MQTALAGTNGDKATSLSAKLLNAPQAGDFLVAFVGVGDASSVTTAPTGWTVAKDVAGHTCQQMSGPAGSQGEQVFVHRVVAGEAGSYVFAFKKANAYAIAVDEVSNVSSAAPIDACAGTEPPTSSSYGPVSSATVTATTAGDLPLAGYAPSTSGMTATPRSGWSSTVYANAMTPYMTLDAEAGAPIGSGTSTTPSTTFGNLGGKAIVYAPSVALLLEPAPVAPVATSATNPAVLQSAVAGSNGGSVSALTASLSKGPQAGNYVVAFIGNGDTTTVTTPPIGWTAAKDSAGHLCQQMSGPAGSQGEQVFIHHVGAAESGGPYSFAFSKPSSYAIGLVEMSNLSATAPIDACAGTQPAASSSTGPVTAATVAAVNAGDVPVVGYAPSTSGMTVTSQSGWSSILYANTQTPYMTLDLETGTSLSSGSSVTPSTTFGNLGGSAIVYAPSVVMLFAPSGTPSVAPTSAPSATPAPIVATPVPTSAPSAPPAGAPTFQNGVEYPVSWRPYGANSAWNQPVPANPTIWSQSSAVVAQQFNATGLQNINLYSEAAGNYDAGHPVYFASASDPTVSIVCRSACDRSDNGGYPSTMHIPAQARPAAPGCGTQSNCAGDHHMTVIQPDMTEIDFYGVTSPSGNWGTGGNTTVSAGGVQSCGSFTTGQGIDPNGTVTVGGACGAAGLLRANELLAGRINHALFLVVNCAAPSSQNQYPVQNGFGTDVCTNYANGDAAPPLGARMWLDYSDAQIAAMNVTPWEKAIMYALHDYGGFIMDDTAGGSDISGFNLKAESGEMFYAFGQSDPFAGLAGGANGWYSQTISGDYVPRVICGSSSECTSNGEQWQPLNSGVDFRNHMHYLDPCVTKKTC